MKNDDSIIGKFKNQHIVVKILDIIFIMVFIYGIITMRVNSIIGILIVLIAVIPLCQWYFKKEDN